MAPTRSVPAAALAVALSGLILGPVPLVLLALRSGDFQPLFYLEAALPGLGASAYLLWRYLGRPRTGPDRPALLAGEAVAWLAVGALFYLASGFNLLVGIERWGMVAGAFLAMSLVAIPLVVRRPTAIEGRLGRWPRGTAGLAAILLLAAAAAVGLADLASPPRFPGGHRRPPVAPG
jgi:hypothetical protein